MKSRERILDETVERYDEVCLMKDRVIAKHVARIKELERKYDHLNDVVLKIRVLSYDIPTPFEHVVREKWRGDDEPSL